MQYILLYRIAVNLYSYLYGSIRNTELWYIDNPLLRTPSASSGLMSLPRPVDNRRITLKATGFTEFQQGDTCGWSLTWSRWLSLYEHLVLVESSTALLV